MAAIPDFGGLAAQQQAANDDATRRTTWSQRPDQTNAMGSITWNQTPDGRWINNTSLSGAAQGLWDQSMGGQGNLAGQIGQGLDYSSLGAMPQVGQYNQEVINSWNALQNPGLQKSEDAARARAAAMGLTMGSNAWNDQERSLGNTRIDAGNKAILAGYQQGNTEYDQALRARQQGAGEIQNKYSAALSGNTNLGGMRDSLDPNKWATKVPTGAAYIPQTIYGAAQDTFNAQRQNENADIAQRQQNVNTGVGAIQALGGINGITSGLGNLWGGAQNLWNWGSNAYDTWNINNNVLTPADQMNYGL